LGAVIVHLAIAGHGFANALPVNAVVPKGTDFTVVAFARCGWIFAATGDGAEILCAGILVITFDGVTGAATGDTMIGYGARVFIVT